MKNITRDWLYEQYITLGKTAQIIANDCGYSVSTIAHKLSDFGIIREPKEYNRYLNRDWLYEEYIVKNKTQYQIAEELGVSQSVIASKCNCFNIHKDKNVLFTREFLYDEHIVKHKSMIQIAKETGHNNTSVRKYMDMYGIPVWTTRDNTNEYIDNNDGTTYVKVYDQYGYYLDKFIIDTFNKEKCQKYKWVLITDNIVKDRPVYRVSTGSHPTIVLGRYLLDLPSDVFVDHKDNNALNNTIENLRPATRSQNQRNHDLQNNNKSGVSGVCFTCNKWYAQIGFNGDKCVIGKYKEKAHAVYARYFAEKLLYGNYRSNRNDLVIEQYINKCPDDIKKSIESALIKKFVNRGWLNDYQAVN